MPEAEVIARRQLKDACKNQDIDKLQESITHVPQEYLNEIIIDEDVELGLLSSVDMLEIYIEGGFDVNTIKSSRVGRFGENILHTACKYFHLVDERCIRLLVYKGIRINVEGYKRQTPLKYLEKYLFDDSAYINRAIECLKFLLASGADIFIDDNHGNGIFNDSDPNRTKNKARDLVMTMIRFGAKDINITFGIVA